MRLCSPSATATGQGRNGHSRPSDGIVDVDLATPAEIGGPGGATNPEQLNAAGYAACFLSELKLIARREQLPIAGAAVTADISLNSHPRTASSAAPCAPPIPGADGSTPSVARRGGPAGGGSSLVPNRRQDPPDDHGEHSVVTATVPPTITATMPAMVASAPAAETSTT